MSKPKLTIGIATHSDWDGCYFTLQSARLQDSVDCEFVIIDNSPNTPHGEELRKFLPAIANTNPVQYVSFEDSTGTTQTREEIFKRATGEAVLVMDCHVLLKPNALARLKDHYDSNPDTLDLFSGPMLLDSMTQAMSHFEPVWRGQMWGIWAQAWRTLQGSMIVAREEPHPSEVDGEGKPIMMAKFHRLNTMEEFTIGSAPIYWSGHEKLLVELGMTPAAWDDDAPPFETPGQGLGLFTCRKDAWLGFNPNFRLFGGEEMYIHEKYRQAGRKHITLPFLKWVHRFGRVGGAKYPNSVEKGKMRNYVLGFQELGLEFEPIRHHFVDEIGVDPNAWTALIADPLSFEAPLPPTPCPLPNFAVTSNLGMPMPGPHVTSLEQLGAWIAATPRDLNEHVKLLQEVAGKSESIVEVSKRRESSVIFLSAHPKTLVSFQSENDSLLTRAQMIMKSGVETKGTVWSLHVGPITSPPPYGERADMLYIDSNHTYAKLKSELLALAPLIDKYIVLRGTAGNGEHGEDGGPGLWATMKEFLKANPEWFVQSWTAQQYGMTILSRVESERPEKPLRPWPKGKGAGTELKLILKWWGIEATPNCTCTRRANQMDDEGVDWCYVNFNTIMGWLEEEATKRNARLKAENEERKKLGVKLHRIYPFVPMAARMVLNRALKTARKKEKAGEYRE